MNAWSALPFLMLTGRSFHRVTAAFSNHLLLYITPHVCGMISSNILAILLDDKQQVPITNEGQSITEEGKYSFLLSYQLRIHIPKSYLSHTGIPQ